jgi:hypothetical protein
MKIATIDLETFWDTGYTLSKMTPLEYVQDERFELICSSIKIDGYPTDVFFGEKRIRHVLSKFDWSQYAILGHNMSAFDAYVLAYRLGIKPRMWLCTLAMARPIHSADGVGCSLAKLVKHYGLGVKDNTVLLQTRGKRLEDFTPAELAAMEKYNREDTDQCYALFNILKRHYAAAELWQLDALVRLRTEPAFELDFGLLETALSVERSNKHKSLLELARSLGIKPDDWSDEAAITEHVRSELASAPKFVALLEKLGVDVPMKVSPKGNRIPALAKNDEPLIALQEHPEPLVAAAVAARIEVKSTLTETRIQAFQTAGKLAGGRLPLPIRYCGAIVSGRDSGEEYNPQNMTRIGKKPKPSDALRKSLVAPDGHLVIVADQSGIELRTSHTLAQVEESMRLYALNPKADLYRAFGAELYQCTPEEVDPVQRQACKVGQLQLQFGSGPVTYLHKARVDGGLVDMQLPEATTIVTGWRSKYFSIVKLWNRAGEALRAMANGQTMAIDPWVLATTTQDGVILRTGREPPRMIRYPGLRYLDEAGVIQEFFKGVRPDDEAKVKALWGWWYGFGREKRRLYGAKVFQNIVQALARDSVFDAAVDYYKKTGLRFNLRTHDELAYVVPEKKAEALLDQLQGILRTPPRWWPELVVWSEGGIAKTYGDAK